MRKDGENETDTRVLDYYICQFVFVYGFGTRADCVAFY